MRNKIRNDPATKGKFIAEEDRGDLKIQEGHELLPDYEGVDDLAGFSDRALLVHYRSSLLEKTKQQVQFIRQQFGDLYCVAESCCGNGRLLVALAKECEQLWGYDIASSRIRFA